MTKKGRVLGLLSASFMKSNKDGWSRAIKEEGIWSPATELMKEELCLREGSLKILRTVSFIMRRIFE